MCIHLYIVTHCIVFCSCRPLSDNLMSFAKPTTGVKVVESPLYGRDSDFLMDNEEQQEDETDSQHDTDTEGKKY